MPDLWLRIFLDPDQADALGIGRAYMRTVAPFYFFFGLGLALYFACQGAGRMRWPVIGSICRLGFAIGGALILTSRTDLGVRGVFIAIAAAMLVYGTVTGIAVRLTRWR